MPVSLATTTRWRPRRGLFLGFFLIIILDVETFCAFFARGRVKVKTIYEACVKDWTLSRKFESGDDDDDNDDDVS